MSVNTFDSSLASSSRLRLPAGEEQLTASSLADLELRVPATISGPKRTESAKGRIWVTDQRVIFIADTLESTPSGPSQAAKYDAPPALLSLVVSYSTLLSATFHLPLFSSNHLLLSFLPDAAASTTSASTSNSDASPSSDPGPGPNSSSFSSLPDPGRGGKIEAKIIVNDGSGHALWKRIEGERGRWAERRREEETLPTYSAGSKDGETRLL